MDFIERLFGVSPDGGSGAAEALLLLLPVLVYCLYRVRRTARNYYAAADGSRDR